MPRSVSQAPRFAGGGGARAAGYWSTHGQAGGRAAGYWSTHGRAGGDRRLKACLEVDWDRRRVEQQHVDLRQQQAEAVDSSGSQRAIAVARPSGSFGESGQPCRQPHSAIAALRPLRVALLQRRDVAALRVKCWNASLQRLLQQRTSTSSLRHRSASANADSAALTCAKPSTTLSGRPYQLGCHAMWETMLSGIPR